MYFLVTDIKFLIASDNVKGNNWFSFDTFNICLHNQATAVKTS